MMMKYILRIIGIASIVIGSIIPIACVTWAAGIPTPESNAGRKFQFLPVPHVSASMSIGAGPVRVELSPTEAVLLAFAAFGVLTVAGALLLRHESPRDKS
jgi:hypothetical protein